MMQIAKKYLKNEKEIVKTNIVQNYLNINFTTNFINRFEWIFGEDRSLRYDLFDVTNVPERFFFSFFPN